ncbi:hypothetical protein VTO42DRAFT_679 [Malbranchea cinnamomea]
MIPNSSLTGLLLVLATQIISDLCSLPPVSIWLERQASGVISAQPRMNGSCWIFYCWQREHAFGSFQFLYFQGYCSLDAVDFSLLEGTHRYTSSVHAVIADGS